ncbi:uncharacterized protein LOC131890237 isoform X2 [Tigriopus californicus]|uniref:uncharacterized protein LOC131890237 isoform X2 n=1 Tax=Tigriopus californicus TaxID=6832 RepID=UPI0027DAA9F1|nr:uncharacterized protein LOC131890237 isoform X2 [Tigriopus californicus]
MEIESFPTWLVLALATSLVFIPDSNGLEQIKANLTTEDQKVISLRIPPDLREFLASLRPPNRSRQPRYHDDNEGRPVVRPTIGNDIIIIDNVMHRPIEPSQVRLFMDDDENDASVLSVDSMLEMNNMNDMDNMMVDFEASERLVSARRGTIGLVRAHFLRLISSEDDMPGINLNGEEISSAAEIRPGVFSCGHQTSEMFINFINPNYPAHDSTTGSCHFRILVERPEVCQLRVDFVDTEMLTPRQGNCADQFLVVGGDIWPTGLDKLCGINTDQHFYLHLDRERANQGIDDEINVDFTITTVNSKPYKFGFWVTQVDCSSQPIIEAPAGCTQYFMSSSGTLKTFNFEGVQYLANQNYRACFRTTRSSCFMSFSADTSQFELSLFSRISRRNMDPRRFFNRNQNQRSRALSGVGANECGLDYLLIPGGRPNATKNSVTLDRFCGGELNFESNAESSSTIYSDISGPIAWVQLVTAPRNDFTRNLLSQPRTRVMNNFNLFRRRTSTTQRSDFENTGAGIRLRYAHVTSCDSNK